MEYLATPRIDDPRIKGKARSFAAMAARDLRVPKAFATLDALFRRLCPPRDWPKALDEHGFAVLSEAERCLRQTPFPAEFESALAGALAGLGGERFAVRSSFAGEDEVGRLAAGVFVSRLDVPAGEVGQAIREVLVSAVSPAAVAYALSHGSDVAHGPFCVLVHPFLPGDAEGTVALAADEPVLECRRGNLPQEVRNTLFAGLRSMVAVHGPTEMEWVLDGGRLFFIQSRPYEPPPAPREFSGFSGLCPQDPPASAWTWDASHNPYPLSPAHRGLVEWVDERCRIGIRQKVFGGYLFYTPDTRPLPPAIPPSEAGQALERLGRAFEHQRAEFLRAPSLEAALALFSSVYEPLFGVIQPAVKARRKALADFLRAHIPSALPMLADLLRDVPTLATVRRQLAARVLQAEDTPSREAAVSAYLEQFGDEAPVWDIAEPTYAERGFGWGGAEGGADEHSAPDVLTDITAAVPAIERDRFTRLLAEAREGVALSEEDDWLYARAQACVRLAIRDLGEAWAAQGFLERSSDVFYLPLALLRSVASTGRPGEELRALVGAERQALQRARETPPGAPPARDGVVIGTGIGGKFVGRVRLHRAGTPAVAGGEDVLVARTLLPTELPLVSAAALVVETGGVLDHVASQARERRLPAIVGAQGAYTVFRDGDRILVDGDRGVAIRL